MAKRPSSVAGTADSSGLTEGLQGNGTVRSPSIALLVLQNCVYLVENEWRLKNALSSGQFWFLTFKTSGPLFIQYSWNFEKILSFKNRCSMALARSVSGSDRRLGTQRSLAAKRGFGKKRGVGISNKLNFSGRSSFDKRFLKTGNF